MADRLDIQRKKSAPRAAHANARRRSQLPQVSREIDDQLPEDEDISLPSWIPTWPMIASIVGRNWSLCLVMIGFVLSSLFIPVMANVPSTDDWAYSRSVEILIHDGRLEILDLTVVTLLFQVAWGTLFSIIFGVGFGAMRLSTVVLVGLSIPAMYDICRSLGAKRCLAAAGATLYVFNPLTYALAFTFMSDPQFTALMVMSIALYLRAIRTEEQRLGFLIAGSILAACAFLVRQQGLLIPAAVGGYLFLSGQWRPNRHGLRTALAVAGIPAFAALSYFGWLTLLTEAPEQQGAFVDQIRSAGWDDARLLASRMAFIEVAYLGLFVLPLALSLFGAIPRWRPTKDWRSLALMATWGLILLLGTTTFFDQGRLMPYIPQFVGFHGLGPNDIWGGRPSLVPHWIEVAGTWLCLGAAATFGLFVSNAAVERPSPQRSAAGMLVCIGLFQVLGILPPSFHFRDWIVSVDRYLLPLVPVVIALLIWAIRDIPVNTLRLWLLIALMATFSVMATRDSIVFQQAVWSEARRGISYGVPLTMLDAGASWDGYHLYEYSEATGVETQTIGGPWWTDLFGKATDSTYMISTTPVAGYTVVEYREYSSWLNPEPTYIYLLRRDSWPGPP